MSATAAATTDRTGTAEGGSEPDVSRRAVRYRRRIDRERRVQRCSARRQTVYANVLSLLLVAAGAGVGVTAVYPPLGTATVVLGALVVVLEGVSRVLRPGARAARARRAADALDRECRLFDARGRGYRTGDAAAEAAFVDAVERILDHESAEEERDGDGSLVPDPPAAQRALRTVE